MNQYYQKITAKQTGLLTTLSELWHKKQLLGVLIARDVKVRYKNTVLGVAWIILQPLLSTLVFTMIFAQGLKFAQNQDHYLAYTVVGFVFWQFVSGSLTAAASCVYEQSAMIKKIYFPRLYLPLTVVGRNLVDLFFTSILTWLILFFSGIKLTFTGFLGYLLAIIILANLISGLSWIFSSLNARYRDFRHLFPFILQVWFYATPIFYPSSFLSGRLSWLQYNPLTLILTLARQAIFQQYLDFKLFGLLLLLSLIVLWLGLKVFKKIEQQLIDWI